MCGIHAVISASDAVPSPINGLLKQSLENRGPDHLGHVTRTVQLDAQNDREQPSKIHLSFTSTVLALRGDHVAEQPLQAGNGSVLCWNGEAWRFEQQPVMANDAEALMLRLSQPTRTDASGQEHVLSTLRSIQGPFSMVYYDAADRRVYFARDRLGRRSLLIHKDIEHAAVSFSSIAGQPVTDWLEVNADGVYSINLETLKSDIINSDEPFTRHDWCRAESDVNLVSSVGLFNATVEKPADEEPQAPESTYVQQLEKQLLTSLSLRVVNVPEPPRHKDAEDVRVAVLFSGGLDCTVLARLAHNLVPASQGLDLINVAFENPRLVANYLKQPVDKRAPDFYETCPDRNTGRKAFAELKQACPERSWRFIAVNVPFQEAMAHKATVVSLIYPHDTEMDLSIALALYFAARGIGQSYTLSSEWVSDAPIVKTPARVLLSGLGADELFGGYARHEIAYKRDAYRALVEELRLDVSRIGQRNLGRDDRVMTSWSKEVRFPFLDEEVVKFAIGCPAWIKCDFGQPEHATGIEPAKRLLRLVADGNGLPTAAREKKRAIQFGSRTAKMEHATGRVKGTASIVPA